MIYVSEDIWDFDLEAALKDISDQRREQALKFKHEQGQRLCVLAYQLLKEGLQKEYGLTDNPIFEYNEHGKPSIVGHPEIYFNLSHCKEAVVCAISDKPVGVDVEGRREMGDKVVKRVFSPYEIEAIMQSEEPFDIGFIRLWTAKESIVKYTKEGLSHGLDDIEIDPGSYRIRKCTGIDVENVYLSRFEADGYYITVCSQYEQFCKAISIPEIQ